MILEPLSLDHLEPWAELLAAAFDRPVPAMVRSLERMHGAFPVVAWGAWDSDTLAAQYSCLVRPLEVPGQDLPVMVGMSVNMAVHPAYRGQGLISRVSAPVYEEVRARGGVAGVGFSNTQGVRVDRRSRGYGYRVVGRLRSTLAVLVRPPQVPMLALTEHWQGVPSAPTRPDEPVRFADRASALEHRYAESAAARVRFGTWTEGETMRGVLVYRPSRWAGLRGASLLAACGDDAPELVARWARTLWREGGRVIHVLSTPASPVLTALRGVAVTMPIPASRSPYFLTVKALGDETPAVVFDIARWDCTGGEIL